MNYIKELQEVIKKLHECESEYLETVSVKETFQDQTVWEGDVEVFDIRGHPNAKRCYAWAHASGNEGRGKRYVAVLELPPVDSPQNAVRAAIVDEVKKSNAKKGN